MPRSALRNCSNPLAQAEEHAHIFRNPYGGPCKIQKEVLDKLQTERKGNFNIASVSTMKQEDQKAFYDYGIRSLPSLVPVDKSGKTLSFDRNQIVSSS